VKTDCYPDKCIRVGLVAPEPIRRAGLVSVFEVHAYIQIVRGELETLLADPSLQYLILDLSSNGGWLKVLFCVRRKRPDIRQVIVGPSDEDEHVLQCIAAGARAYLDRNSGPWAVRQAVECVIDGTIWAPRRLMSALIDRLLASSAAGASRGNSNGKDSPSRTSWDAELSPREQEVLKLITMARSNREIAHVLGIEERTVKAYVASLFRKTGIESRVALVIRATQESLRNPTDLY
jgi:DNA-binding NarL/FixJ family response regulator